jgi:enoyl-CoA hydratase
MGTEKVELSVTGSIAWLTLKRPEVLNAIDRAMAHQYAAYLRELRERSDVRVIVTRGEGRAFCAGSDLQELAPLSPAEAAAAEREQGNTFALLDTLPQPTIAMLHGYVLGGGVGLAVYHDFRIAAVSAILGMPEVELGWTPPWAMGRLVDVIGGANARWIAMACVRVTASEAKALGLVHEVVPDEQLIERVETFARQLADLPPAAVYHTKVLINQMSPLRGSQWDAAAAAAFETCYATPEAKEKVAAFIARRKEKK